MLDQPPPDPQATARPDPFAVAPRRRPSALRLLGIAIGSVIVTALAFRAIVEIVRVAIAE